MKGVAEFVSALVDEVGREPTSYFFPESPEEWPVLSSRKPTSKQAYFSNGLSSSMPKLTPRLSPSDAGFNLTESFSSSPLLVGEEPGSDARLPPRPMAVCVTDMQVSPCLKPPDMSFGSLVPGSAHYIPGGLLADVESNKYGRLLVTWPFTILEFPLLEASCSLSCERRRSLDAGSSPASDLAAPSSGYLLVWFSSCV